jgi:hypothetical protein
LISAEFGTHAVRIPLRQSGLIESVDGREQGRTANRHGSAHAWVQEQFRLAFLVRESKITLHRQQGRSNGYKIERLI